MRSQKLAQSIIERLPHAADEKTMDYHTRFNPELVGDQVFIAANATVVGRVSLGDRSSVWFGSVARGDSEWIKVGANTNIQDLAILHADAGVPCQLGSRVTVGHAAIVHGALVEDDVMIGMRAVVLNGCTIGHHSIVAAGALIPEGTSIPPHSLVIGVPGKVVRQVSDHELKRIEYAWKHYVEAGAAFRSTQST